MRAVSMFLTTVLMTACAPDDAADPDLVQSDETAAWNAEFSDQADVHHTVLINGASNRLAFSASGQERHRVSFEVTGQAQIVTIEVQGDAMETAFHGSHADHTPGLEMQIAEELETVGTVEVILQPGTYTYDFWQPTSSWNTPSALTIITRSGIYPRAPDIEHVSPNDEIQGTMRFGERKTLIIEGPGTLGILPLTDEAVDGCVEAHVYGGDSDERWFSSDSANFSMTVWSDQEMTVDLIACRPGAWRYEHKVTDLD